MALPDVPGVLKTRLIFDVGASLNAHSHVFWHTTGTGVSSGDLTDLANQVAFQWDAHMSAQVPNTTHLREVEAIDLGHPGTVAGLWAGDHPGSYPTAGQAAEVCVVISLKIARRYRGGKPRVYLPMGVTAQMNNPTSWQSTFVSAVDAAWGAFTHGVIIGAPNASVDDVVSVSYYNDKAPRATPVVDHVLTHSTSATPGSQRRRMNRP